jgi:predicted ester cyclase
MSAEENKAMVRRFVEEVWNKGNVGVIDEIGSPDWVEHDPDRPEELRGLGDAKRRVEEVRSAFPDLYVTLEDLIAEGEKVVSRWRARGTHQGELLGIPPTGRQVEFTGMRIQRISGGKFVETWHQPDTLGMMRQLGLISEPAQQPET